MSLSFLNRDAKPFTPSTSSAFKQYVQPMVQSIQLSKPVLDVFHSEAQASSVSSSNGPKSKTLSYKAALVSNLPKTPASQSIASFKPIEPKRSKWINPRSLRSLMQGVDLSVQQKDIGNCYWIAAMDAAFHSPAGEALLNQTIQEENRNLDGTVKEYKITFPSGRWGAFYAGEVGLVKHGKKPLQGSDLFTRLELAYAKMMRKYRNNLRDMHQRYPNDGRGHTPILIEGGESEDALHNMFGGTKVILKAVRRDKFVPTPLRSTEPFSTNPINLLILESKLARMESDTEHYYLLCATTPSVTKDAPCNISTETGKQFFRNHVYSIRSFNMNEQTITVADPHDTSKDKTLSFEEFCQVFYRVSGIRLSKASLEKTSPEAMSLALD